MCDNLSDSGLKTWEIREAIKDYTLSELQSYLDSGMTWSEWSSKHAAQYGGGFGTFAHFKHGFSDSLDGHIKGAIIGFAILGIVKLLSIAVGLAAAKYATFATIVAAIQAAPGIGQVVSIIIGLGVAVYALYRIIDTAYDLYNQGSSFMYAIGYVFVDIILLAVSVSQVVKGIKTAMAAKSGGKTVDDILDGAIDTTTGTGNVTKNYTKPGGYQAGLDDFNSLGLKNVKESSNGALVGQLDDGTYVNYRFSDKNGWSLEIQYGSRNKVKIRYE